MIKILFVCHGNICRSPMGEFIFKQLVEEKGLADKFHIASAATSTEELGCDIYPPAKRKLQEKGVPFTRHSARQMRSDEYNKWDYILLMDRNNMRNIKWIIPQDPDHKIHKLLERKDVADPWYTGAFEETYQDVLAGCKHWLSVICEKHQL